MICYHGAILTCDQNNTVANYLVEDEGIIRYVGSELPAEYASVPVHELGEKRSSLPLPIRSSISPVLPPFRQA